MEVTQLDLLPPGDNVAEITLIGTGGGYGESIVIHLGKNNWIIVDSCTDPDSGKNLSIEYLKALKVDCRNNVKLIVCSHWHDDHILGISSALKECENAEFCMARATDQKKFLQFLRLDYKKCKYQPSNSSTVEFNTCIEILKTRNQPYVEAIASKSLYTFRDREFLSEVIALSPSDFISQEFDYEISQLIKEYGALNRKVVDRKPNKKAVGLFVKIGAHRAILGSDMEIGEDSNAGWLNILDRVQIIDEKSNYFKISHHGSSACHHDRIWDQLLITKPVGTLSSWNKNDKLPTEEMLNHFCQLSDKIYITSIPKTSKAKKREKQIEKMIYRFRPGLTGTAFSFGAIQSRISLIDPGDFWRTELFGAAIHVNNIINTSGVKLEEPGRKTG